MLTDFERRLCESMHELTPEPPTPYLPSTARRPRSAAETAPHPQQLTTDTIELDLASTGDRRKGRTSARTLAILASAAAVAALVTGVTWIGASSDDTQSGRAKTAIGVLPSRTLAFSIESDLGLHIASATTLDNHEQSADLVNATRSTHLQLDVFARGVDDDPVIHRLANGQHVSGLHPVLVGGLHGFGGTVPNGTSTLVAWPYAHDSWAMIVSQGSSPSVAYTVKAGEAVNFAGRTTIRTPIRISAAPAGMHLTYVDSAYAVLTDNRPLENDREWHTEAEYAPSGKGNGIEISTTTLKKGTVANPPGAEPITINGHPGSWDPAEHAVCYDDPTNTVGVCAQEQHIPTTAPLTMSRRRLVHVAESITLTARPADKSNWFTAAVALPRRAR